VRSARDNLKKYYEYEDTIERRSIIVIIIISILLLFLIIIIIISNSERPRMRAGRPPVLHEGLHLTHRPPEVLQLLPGILYCIVSYYIIYNMYIYIYIYIYI